MKYKTISRQEALKRMERGEDVRISSLKASFTGERFVPLDEIEFAIAEPKPREWWISLSGHGYRDKNDAGTMSIHVREVCPEADAKLRKEGMREAFDTAEWLVRNDAGMSTREVYMEFRRVRDALCKED